MDNVSFTEHVEIGSENKGFFENERKHEVAVHSLQGTCFRSYGASVLIESDDPVLVELGILVARKALVGKIEIIERGEVVPDHTFGVHRNSDGRLFLTNEGQASGPIENEIDFSRLLNSLIRVHVAEKARGWVFIHAGVVGWKGRAIVIPAMSHQGKTTLVGELLRLGAEYFSDEYAVIDEAGLVHPFERDLSVRIPGHLAPIEVPAATFGPNAAKEPIEVGAVILTRYEEGAEWKPEELSLGQGILETIPAALPINFNTDFSLKVLNTAFRRAIMLRSLRGDARDTAESILSAY